MNRDRRVRWLRISFRTGAIVDGLVAAAMLGQAFIGHASPLTGHVPDAPYRYAMGLAGSLMLGWTVLLAWADRKPLERRAVLPITCIVILGLMGSCVYAAGSGFVSWGAMLPVLGGLAGLFALFMTSWGMCRTGSDSAG